ncbi:MAG: hypothetical protein CMA12_01680 [Euryarchaeota archaeon]|nr:hypothetical protein [Euryarchaeota archaeon]OUW22994.1 MAG: hypothetical protein CBD33_00255 [Euryarchaeota archaeon TMED173]
MNEWGSKTVDELKHELRSRGMSVSGKKADLMLRLNEASRAEGVVEAEIMGMTEGKVSSTNIDNVLILIRERVRSKFSASILVLIIIIGFAGGGVVLGPDLVNWIKGEEDYELIDFDQNQTRSYAEGLVNLGHPLWGGRLSGTVEEENAAQSIKTNFSNSGIPSTIEEFEIPIYYMGNQFDLMICQPGNIGGLIGGPTPCSSADLNRDETDYVHTVDYVVQGYSGSVNIPASSNTQVIDLGIGNESENWESAANGVGIVWLLDGEEGGAGTESNTVLMKRAQENSLRGLITINSRQNCDELVSGDCVPYSKSLDIMQFEEKPYNVGFVMVSRSVGESILEEVVNGAGMLQFQVDVDNQDEGQIHVVCGIIQGETEELIIIGAHHDTVYNGQGAVDNTAGTATVQEIARQIALFESEVGAPKMTIYFCTWGGEEGGLWGSSEWVDKHRENLEENLRLYINLDMNHVDAERNSGVTLQGNSFTDVRHIKGIVEVFSASHPELYEKYGITVRELESEQMPDNSDHAPFVFEIHQDEEEFGRAMLCYGSGSSEYHTYLDNMDRFNEESLAVSGIIYGSLIRHLAWG